MSQVTEVVTWTDFVQGNRIDGFHTLSVLTNRSLDRSVSVNGKSPVVKGKLQLCANPYKVQSHNFTFHPSITREYVTRMEIVNGVSKYVTVEHTAVYRPLSAIGDWYDLTRHAQPDQPALRSFWSDVNAVSSNLLQVFAERQQAIDMIAGKATRVFNAYRNVKRGKFRRAARNLGLKTKKPRSKQASGQWLELQYGWLPLLGDIHTLANLEPAAGGTVVGSSVSTSTVKYPNNGTTTATIAVKYGATVTVSDPVAAFSHNMGLANPGLLVWELLPFSFVVDWFLPVGDYIEMLTADIGLKFSDSYKSTKVKAIVDRPPIITRKNKLESQISGCVGTSNTFTRQLLEFIPKPNLAFKNPISPMHLANAVALGRQLKKE